MSWKNESQRHAMSARGIKTGMQTFFRDFDVSPDYPMRPQPLTKSRQSLWKPRDFFEEVFSVHVTQFGYYDPDVTANFASNRFDSDAEVMGYIDLLQQQGAIVMVEPLGPTRRDESDTLIVTIPKENAFEIMKIIHQMDPDEFNPVRSQLNTYRLWWD